MPPPEPQLCPRCEVHSFTPPRAALSRLDNKTYVCPLCGNDEAMRDAMSLPPRAPDEWPVRPSGARL